MAATMRSTTTLTKLLNPNHPTLHLTHPTPEPFTWNTLIIHRPPSSSPHSPLSIYLRMRRHRVPPDSYTFPSLLRSSSPSILPSLHAHLIHIAFASHPFVQTSLITSYSHHSNLPCARRVFDDIPNPDLPTWNSIVSACLKAGSLAVARRLFLAMPERNVVSWTSMIEGHVKCGDCGGAMSLFKWMLDAHDVGMNEYTMSSVLSACAGLGALEQGRRVHGYICASGLRVDAVLGTSLVDMYAKCGCIESARRVFDGMGDGDRDVMAWTAMIVGLAMHGRVGECLGCFAGLQRRMRPNAVTFLGVLCACAHAGLVDEGREYFEAMRVEFAIAPEIQHYGCMVDLYSRAGRTEEAIGLVNSMGMEPDAHVWGAILSGSGARADARTCEAAIARLVEVEPAKSAAGHVLLSNVYAKMGRWEGVRSVRGLMEENRMKKTPGCSVVEVGGVHHEFYVGDESHAEARRIYSMLGELTRRVRMVGCGGETGEVFLDLDQEDLELVLFHHF
ncbi:Pentatricopeptide repeat-containing protein [Acorus calamus]|uniref:Pentatricopeptide repeat-containing protein n=1 Tax=Acorus calamus TaxID=4465 RepID=A0AAV9CYH4_ACOCL|nr:Pentatricopeptide repeat-containing protein [Acorus calamus]